MTSALSRMREIADKDGDQGANLLEAVGGDKSEQVLHCQVLAAVRPGSKFIPGSKTILRTDNNLQENRFQGSTFLVIGVGPGAFTDSHIAQFYGRSVKVGDWILARKSDGLEMLINGVPCVLFEDVNVKMVVDDPDRYY